MKAQKWPCVCGKDNLIYHFGTYSCKTRPPAKKGKLVVSNTAWQKCPTCNQEVLSPELKVKVDKFWQEVNNGAKA